MEYKIALIPGDGIGPEVVREAKKVLDTVCEKYGHTFSYTRPVDGRRFHRCAWRSADTRKPLIKPKQATLY